MTVLLERPLQTDAQRPATPPPAPKNDRRRRKAYGAATAAGSVLLVAGAAALLHTTGATSVRPPAGLTLEQVKAVSVAAATTLTSSDFGRVETVQVAGGPRLQVLVKGLGLVQIAPHSNQVLEVIWDGRLSSGPNDTVSGPAAQALASTFAATHIAGFSQLAPRETVLIDHGAWREYRASFQARSGTAWLPKQIAVGVNAATGQVAYYWNDLTPSNIDTTPAVTESQAVDSVRAAAGNDVIIGKPQLEVLEVNGRQILAWSMTANASGSVGGLRVLNNSIALVDATTGAVMTGAVSQ